MFGRLLRLMFPAAPSLTPQQRRARQLTASTGNAPGRCWKLEGHEGEVVARTRSEARAAFKRTLGLSRLPAGTTPQPA